MKMLVQEIEGEGLEFLLGKTITLYCINYIYTGELLGVNSTCVKLGSPKIVYETGPHEQKTWQDAQSLPNEWYVQLAAVESFGVFKC